MNASNLSTKPLRDVYHLTQRQMSIMFDIPLRTIENWESRSCCPAYVFAMMSELLGRGFGAYNKSFMFSVNPINEV